MLVLTRKEDESIMIGEDDASSIEIRIVAIKNGHVKIGIKAPRETPVHRREVYDAIMNSNQEAAASKQDKVVSKDFLSSAAQKVKGWGRK